MNSKAKMKKNLTRLVCLVLAAIMIIGCFAYFTMEEVETYDYSAGLTEEGFFEGVTALDNVVLSDYHSYTIPEEATVATEDEIKSKIDAEIMAAYVTQEKDTDADRVVADGDSINIDFVGKIDGVEFEGGSTDGVGSDVVIGSGRFIDGFEDQIIGHKAGETFDITVTFPEDYGNEELNGKEAVFTITVNHIYKTIVPELTEDFVKENLSEYYESVADLKAQVAESIVDADTKNHIWGKLMSETTVTSYPQQIHDYEVETRKANIRTSAAQYNMEVEKFLPLIGFETMDDYIEYNGEARTLSEWAEIININKKTLYNRLHKYGWSVERALKEKVHKEFSSR